MISIDNLMRVVHQSQLTEEFEGTLAYDHNEWIEIRMVYFVAKILEHLLLLTRLYEPYS